MMTQTQSAEQVFLPNADNDDSLAVPHYPAIELPIDDDDLHRRMMLSEEVDVQPAATASSPRTTAPTSAPTTNTAVQTWGSLRPQSSTPQISLVKGGWELRVFDNLIGSSTRKHKLLPLPSSSGVVYTISVLILESGTSCDNGTSSSSSSPGPESTTTTTTTTTLARASQELMAYRLFKDFEWLRAQLVAECPGALVRVLPSKEEADACSEERNRTSEDAPPVNMTLQRWLSGVISHPLLRGSPSLWDFLTANDKEYAMAVRNSLRAKQTFALGLKKIGLGITTKESDLGIEEITTHAKLLHTEFTHVLKEEHNYTKSLGSLLSIYQDLSSCLHSVAALEDETIAPSLKTVESTCSEIKNVASAWADHHIRSLDHALTRQIDGSEALKKYTEYHVQAEINLGLQRDIFEKKQKNLDKLRVKQQQLQKPIDPAIIEDTAVAEKQFLVEQSRMNSILQNMHPEITRFHNEKCEDMLEALVEFTQKQSQFFADLEEQWCGLELALSASQDPDFGAVA